MWSIVDKKCRSRLLLGTALYPSPDIMRQAITASASEIITVSLKRELPNAKEKNDYWNFIKQTGCHLLPNTAGCRNAKEAITVANMAREIFETNWIKLEIVGDDYTLQPNSLALVSAAQELNSQGFKVFPYCTDDLVICSELVNVGCRILMPWASPIGSGKGIINPYALKLLRARFTDIQLIVDAGIGVPSDALQAMELGYDAVLLNSAVALAADPVMMAKAFKLSIEAGRLSYLAGRMPERELAKASTPLLDTPFWQQEKYDI